MRSRIIPIFLILLCVSISGCSFTKTINNALTDWDSYVPKVCKEIVRCFNDKDVDGLKELFCEKAANLYDLDSQISYAFEQFEGSIISYYISGTCDMQTSVRNGEYVMRLHAPEIKDIDTDSGNEYSIGFAVYEVYDKMPEKVGIDVISLHDSEGNIIAIIGGENET